MRRFAGDPSWRTTGLGGMETFGTLEAFSLEAGTEGRVLEPGLTLVLRGPSGLVVDMDALARFLASGSTQEPMRTTWALNLPPNLTMMLSRTPPALVGVQPTSRDVSSLPPRVKAT